MPVSRTTVSVPQEVLKQGKARASGWRITFSDYVSRLIEEDIASGRSEITLRQKTPPPARKKKGGA